MNRLIIIFIAMLTGVTLCSCQSKNFVASEGDKLTKDETKALVKCARYFLEKEAKKFKLNGNDLYTINYTTPKVRFQYTGHKEGRMFIKWPIYYKDQKDIHGQPVEKKVVSAILQGDLMTSREWKISIAKKANIIYIKQNKGEQPKPLSPKDFEHLLKM